MTDPIAVSAGLTTIGLIRQLGPRRHEARAGKRSLGVFPTRAEAMRAIVEAAANRKDAADG